MAYAPIITIDDLKTHAYREIIDEIIRSDEDIVDLAIANAIAECKLYLSRYDRAQLFGSAPDDTAATFTDPYLTGLVKDIAMWQLINLGNPNMLSDQLRTRYEDAIATLKLIQSGKANPDWPYFDATGIETPPGVSVSAHSNTKRVNRY